MDPLICVLLIVYGLILAIFIFWALRVSDPRRKAKHTNESAAHVERGSKVKAGLFKDALDNS